MRQTHRRDPAEDALKTDQVDHRRRGSHRHEGQTASTAETSVEQTQNGLAQRAAALRLTQRERQEPGQGQRTKCGDTPG